MLTSMLCAITLCASAGPGQQAASAPGDHLSWGPTPARTVSTGNPIADINADGIIDIYDVLAFLNCWQSGLPCADLNADGVVDINDVLIFVNA